MANVRERKRVKFVDEPMICRRMVRIWLRKSVMVDPSDMAFLKYAVRWLTGSTIVERCKDIAKLGRLIGFSLWFRDVR